MRLGPDARPSESGELSRVCARCLTAADDTHTAADVTKIGKMADPASRYAELRAGRCIALNRLASGLHARLKIRQSGLFSGYFFDRR
jgi:hypothetical protein